MECLNGQNELIFSTHSWCNVFFWYPHIFWLLILANRILPLTRVGMENLVWITEIPQKSIYGTLRHSLFGSEQHNEIQYMMVCSTMLCKSFYYSEIIRKVWVLPKCESSYLMFRVKTLLSDEGPSLEMLDNYSHISAVLKPFWLFHFDFHTAYTALHFYFMVLISFHCSSLE